MEVLAALGAIGACLFCLIAGGVMVEATWAYRKEKNKPGRILLWLSLLFFLGFLGSLFGGD